VQAVTHKRGDTLSWACAFTDENDAAIDLTGYTILAQIRDGDDTLLASLTVANRSNAAGTFDLTAAATVTDDWAPGSYRCDVELTDASSSVRSTDTFVVRVIADVSRSA
jgi:hypothetical protein